MKNQFFGACKRFVMKKSLDESNNWKWKVVIQNLALNTCGESVYRIN